MRFVEDRAQHESSISRCVETSIASVKIRSYQFEKSTEILEKALAGTTFLLDCASDL